MLFQHENDTNTYSSKFIQIEGRMKFYTDATVFDRRGRMPLARQEYEGNSFNEIKPYVQKFANDMFLIDRFVVIVWVYTEGNRTSVGKVMAPQDGFERPCEYLKGFPDACTKLARYRLDFGDGWSEECEEHLMKEEQRNDWFSKGMLRDMYNIKERYFVHPITLKKFESTNN